MKNRVLAKIFGNKIINTICNVYLDHQSAFLTAGAIGFGLATTAVTFRNAQKINNLLIEAKGALDACDTEKGKKSVYTMFLKELAPLAAPIIIFQAASITCSIINKKRTDKIEGALVETVGALAVARTTIDKYQEFQKQAEEALGEERYSEIQNEIYANTEVDGRRFTAIASEGAPGEVLIIDKYSGRPFWSTTEKVEMAAREYSRRLTPSGGYDQQCINDFYELIGNTDLTPNELGERFGHVADVDFGSDYISACFADTHYVFPNGTRIPAFEMYLYPEPGCIDWGC